MKTIKLAWNNLRISERGFIIVAMIIAMELSYQATKHGPGAISFEALGPLVLMWLTVQSALLVGIIRARSMAMNTLFVELMREVRDAKNRLGEELEPANVKLVEDFLGANK